MADIYYEKDGITLYLADNRDVLPFLEDESVDLILTDPPYGMSYASNMRKTHKDDPMVKQIQGDSDMGALSRILYHLNRVLHSDRHSYFFANPMLTPEVMRLLSAGWKVKNMIAWDKGDSPGLGDLETDYANNWEAILYCMKGKRRMQDGRPPSIFRLNWNANRDPVHPTVKPVPLLMWLIKNSTLPGEVVLDPFAGSSTTGMACKILGRKCILIEIDPHFAEVSARRLQQETIDFDLNKLVLPDGEDIPGQFGNDEVHKSESENTTKDVPSLFTPQAQSTVPTGLVTATSGLNQLREVIGPKKRRPGASKSGSGSGPAQQPGLFDK